MSFKFGRAVSLAMSTVMAASVFSVPAVMTVHAANYAPGVTVEADSESPSGYTAHFVYDGSASEKEIESVSVSGLFNYVDAEDQAHTPFEYENGMYVSNMHGLDPTAWGGTFEMSDEDGDGVYELAMPVTSGKFNYQYVIKYAGEEETVSIADPANLPDKMNANGNKNSGDTEKSTFVGHWDAEKQSESPNLDYVLEPENYGKLEYVPYTDIEGNTNYAGVYLPADYDAEREEPYKVVYVSHGGGGDETDWYHLANADYILENLAAEGKTESVILVTMDNTSFKWDYAKTLPNTVDYLIPFMEENYNVSKDAEDRAFCGLSMGGMTTTMMYFTYPEEFGYFGIFSATNLNDYPGWNDAYTEPVVTALVGTCDVASTRVNEANGTKVEEFDAWAKENIPDNYVDEGLYVEGSHDWFTWQQCLAKFLEDVVWTAEQASDLEPGVHVSEEADENGLYEVTFVYEDTDERDAVDVYVSGRLQFYKEEECRSFDASGDNSGIPMYTADQYEDGMFATGYGLNGSAAYTMKETADERFELTLKLPADLYDYDYYVLYDGEKDEEGNDSYTKIQDPANPAPENENNGHNSGHSLVYVGSGEDAPEGEEYIYPRTDDKTGTVEFVTYTAVDGTEQPLGVYLPYGYDSSKTYPTIYVSHGGGGNEEEWMGIGAVPNIMDNLIAEGLTEEAVVVTMDNTYFGWDYDKVIPNVVEYIVPFIEENYSVSKEVDDRAFCGLSMGSMTTNTMMEREPEEFRYFGAFSGGNPDLDAANYNADALNEDVLYLTAGCIDMAYNNNMGISSMDYLGLLEDLGVEYSFDLINGAHDWGVWRKSFTSFVKDYVWSAAEDRAVDTYRLYNPNTGEHFYTTSYYEMVQVEKAGWNYEGVAWEAPEVSDTPVYRLYNANGGEHHYTIDVEEKDALAELGWKDEGVEFYAADDGAVTVYREYNPNQFACNHNFTTNKTEHDTLVGLGWNDESPAWTVLKEGKPLE